MWRLDADLAQASTEKRRQTVALNITQEILNIFTLPIAPSFLSTGSEQPHQTAKGRVS